MTHARFSRGAAGLARPPGMATAASREGPPRTVKAAYLSYYGVGDRVQVRPWIQDFRDYAFDRRPFGASEVLETAPTFTRS